MNAETLERAIKFALDAHKGQTRKGDGRPYIMHPISVMTRIGQNKKSTNAYLLAVAAVLHDTVEDCGVELDTIAKLFGYYVAGLVEELTLDKSKYETIGKQEYLAQEMCKMSSYALCIKLCDRLDNVEDTESMDQEFKDRYFNETKFILYELENKRNKLSDTHKRLIADIKNAISAAA